jgi:deoxycytidine triphosphate deaminase
MSERAREGEGTNEEAPPAGTGLLRDEVLHEMLSTNAESADCAPEGLPLVIGREYTGDYKGYKSDVQPSSLDLHVGDMYEPPLDPKEANEAAPIPVGQKLYLKPGRTAIIRTQEELCVPNDVAIIGFPPTSISTKGILMTNPGHVDPGYQGHMHLTLINMGRDPVTLEKGAELVTLLVFKLDKPVAAGYGQRRPGEGSDPVATFLPSLTPDFMDITNRAKELAKEEADERVKEAREEVTGTAVWIGVAATIVSVVILAFNFATLTSLADAKAANAALEQRVRALENSSKTSKTEGNAVDLLPGRGHGNAVREDASVRYRAIYSRP